MEKWFNVGKIVNTHGVRGEVRVVSRTDFPEERYKAGSHLFLFQAGSEEPVKLTVKTHRQHKSFDLLTFEGLDSLNEAEKLKGAILKVSEDQLGQLEENEYYFHEILGCTVKTIDEEEIGEITEILTPGANDVWVVSKKGEKDILIPYIEDVVKKVDVKEKVIIIEPMEGLLS
ncbi:ribosome maturation factor RimM [Bacillus infantis]|uniref:ribosome maturation factor RimM n=1 Tax=Bacillus infantis TaxID=324767 RepID=UPI003981FAC1